MSQRAYLVGENWREKRITAGSADEAAADWCVREGLDWHRPFLVIVVVEATGERLEVRLP